MREESKNYHQYSTVGFDMNISVSFDWPHEDFACMHIRRYTVWMVAPVYLGSQLPVGIGTTYYEVGVVSTAVGVTWPGNSCHRDMQHVALLLLVLSKRSISWSVAPV